MSKDMKVKDGSRVLIESTIGLASESNITLGETNVNEDGIIQFFASSRVFVNEQGVRKTTWATPTTKDMANKLVGIIYQVLQNGNVNQIVIDTFSFNNVYPLLQVLDLVRVKIPFKSELIQRLRRTMVYEVNKPTQKVDENGQQIVETSEFNKYYYGLRVTLTL